VGDERPLSPAAAPGPPPAGSITDVGGVLVGHHQRVGRGWQTGTTVVFVPDGATPGVDVRGGGPGTRETDALAPTNLIDNIHAVCLTGGSAFGLAAADGVVAWLEERQLGFPVLAPDGSRRGVVPVVPAAVIFDLGRGGPFDRRPDATFGYRAARNARGTQRRWGAVGAGAGAVAGPLQGGVGTASTTVVATVADPATDGASATTSPRPSTVEVTVGAVAVVNSYGAAVDRRSGLPWQPERFGLRRPPAAERNLLRTVLGGPVVAPLNTTIGVIATSARLTKSEATKVAAVAHDGLARAVRPAHALVDGDTIFTLATGRQPLPGADTEAGTRLRVVAFNALLEATADTFAAACTHAVLSAETVGASPAYRSLCPSVYPDA